MSEHIIDRKDATILLAARQIISDLSQRQHTDSASEAYVRGIAKAAYEALNIALISANVWLDIDYVDPTNKTEVTPESRKA